MTTATDGTPADRYVPLSWASPDGRHDAAPVELDGRRPGRLSAQVAALWALVLGFAGSVWGAAAATVAALLADGADADGRWRAATGCGAAAATCVVAVVVLATATSGRDRRGGAGR